MVGGVTLRNVKLEHRRAKMPQDRIELEKVWEDRAANHDLDRAHVESLQHEGPGSVLREDDRDTGGWRERVTDSLTMDASTFTERELRASVLEQGVAELAPEQVSEHARGLVESGEVIELENGLMTTREVRNMEQDIQSRIEDMAHRTGAR